MNHCLFVPSLRRAATPAQVRGLHAATRTSTPKPSFARPDGLVTYAKAHLKAPIPAKSLTQAFTVHNPSDFGSLATQLLHPDVTTYFKEINVVASWDCSYNLRHNSGWEVDAASEKWEEAQKIAKDAGVRLSFDLGSYTALDELEAKRVGRQGATLPPPETSEGEASV